ncbi:CheY-like chemotaxis protein/HD-like signal output (HDOD) protein [Catenuloplanes nepalensis]|uniref:CheY-like chemotaxis protein/HD-like signal output (HDOD) protein n=1 Tax=Catenuloplanes nepalensis TaxID=587533 RepID=A0ABT9MPT2_9ACTN|nr:response regulator [Catenuloplanes nepalensis]MDP9793086.1 CheY-like chemotaxis protein/HD-like signal output (HDOD) protein [Catenuloplanes nepalensis]
MSMPRILFVDDEPHILDGLRRSLRTKRNEWDMSFAPGGEPALEILAERPYDVVVSDMRMPGMDGAQLLTRISQIHPGTARVVLSGHTEREAAIRAAVAGHRFLSKPSDAGAVIDVIGQLIVRTSPAHGERSRRIAGAVRVLPALPQQDAELAGLLGAAEVDYDRLVDAVVQHIGLSAKLLQLSNSGFFGPRPKNASIAAVISAMGIMTIKDLVSAGSAHWEPATWHPAADASVRSVWRHAVATMLLVEQVASPAHRPHAQAAAMLQDVGRLSAIGAPHETLDAPGDPAGTDCAGVPFRDIGVELLHLWGLPSPVVTAVAERDLPHEPAESGLGVAGALRVAHLLVQQTDSRDPADGQHDDELARLLSHPQLAARGVDWRQTACAASARAAQHLES